MDPTNVLYRFSCPADLSAQNIGAVLAYLDRHVPITDLRYVIDSTGRAERVEDRPALVRRCMGSREQLFLNNSLGNQIFSLRAHYLTSFAVEEFWDVLFEHPPDAVESDQVLSIILQLGGALRAYHGDAAQRRAIVSYQQINHGGDEHFVPPYGLPELHRRKEFVSVAVPLEIGWLNYWSLATSNLLGFSESAHTKLFHRWERGHDGSLTFQLTPEPIRLDRTEDIQALQVAYAAFPGVGGRDPRLRIRDEAPTQEGA